MKLFYILFTLILITVALFGVLYYNREIPPLDSINRAKENILLAEKTNSLKYANELLQKAKTDYAKAMVYWKLENEKAFFSRKYNNVRIYSDEANVSAISAIEFAKSRKSNLNSDLSIRIQKLQNEIKIFEKYYKKFPKPKQHTKDFTKGNMLLHESVLSQKQSDFNSSLIKLNLAEELIYPLIRHSKSEIEKYFKNFDEWTNIVEKTILESKKKKAVCIIVDKCAHQCFVYKSGNVIKKYDVEFGPNWIGHKKYKGDKATPEGLYKITQKKTGSKTKYTNALLIDYPNSEDKERFKILKKQNNKYQIGNLIEIHGHGGKGVDWTNGCIGLKDNDMSELMKLTSVGTKIAIVGSIKPLNEIIEL